MHDMGFFFKRSREKYISCLLFETLGFFSKDLNKKYISVIFENFGAIDIFVKYTLGTRKKLFQNSDLVVTLSIIKARTQQAFTCSM